MSSKIEKPIIRRRLGRGRKKFTKPETVNGDWNTCPKCKARTLAKKCIVIDRVHIQKANLMLEIYGKLYCSFYCAKEFYEAEFLKKHGFTAAEYDESTSGVNKNDHTKEVGKLKLKPQRS